MTKQKSQSIEPIIADIANGWLKEYKLDYKLEQESLNTEIDTALNEYYVSYAELLKEMNAKDINEIKTL